MAQVLPHASGQLRSSAPASSPQRPPRTSLRVPTAATTGTMAAARPPFQPPAVRPAPAARRGPGSTARLRSTARPGPPARARPGAWPAPGLARKASRPTAARAKEARPRPANAETRRPPLHQVLPPPPLSVLLRAAAHRLPQHEATRSAAPATSARLPAQVPARMPERMPGETLAETPAATAARMPAQMPAVKQALMLGRMPALMPVLTLTMLGRLH